MLNLTIRQKGLLLVCIPLAFELAFVSVLSWLLYKSDLQLQREQHSKAVVTASSFLMRGALDAAMNAGAYAFTRNDLFGERYDRALVKIDDSFNELDHLSIDNKTQHDKLVLMKKYAHSVTARLSAFRELARSNPDNLFALLQHSRNYAQTQATLEKLTVANDEFAAADRMIERESPEVQRKTRQQIQIVLWLCVAFNVVLALLLAKYFSQEIAGKISILTDNTLRLARKQSLNEKMRGSDELSSLDSVFHDMVAHLRELDQQKQELMAMVGHELRTPLTSIGGTLSLLSRGVLGELPTKAKDKVAITELDVNRLIMLINDLLDSEKLESGQLEMYSRNVAMQTVFERSRISVQGFADKESIEIVIEPTELIAFADEDRLIQVVVNFLSNAIKFSSKNGKITISSKELPDWIETRVVDQGRGIPKDQLDVVFEKFKQVHKEDATVKGGSGLGLHVCKKIIEGLGGEIGADSVIGEGSTFWFRVKKGQQAELKLVGETLANKVD